MVNTELLKLSEKYNISYNVLINFFDINIDNFDIKDIEELIKEKIDLLQVTPLVKWVWGKRQLLKQFQELYPVKFNNYIEPFVGWSAVFLDIKKSKSFLSDMNSELINLYNIVKNKPNELITFLKTLKYDKDLYLEIRAWDRNDWLKNHSEIERAWRFMYLNRTCFNWLYRVNSKGEFNVPFWRYDNPDFIQEKNILNYSKLLNTLNVEINNYWFQESLKNIKKWDFVYLDPPYDTINENNNFTSYDKDWFWKDKQKELVDFCDKINEIWAYFMVSNHNTKYIQEIYSKYNQVTVKAKRNINSKGDWRWEIDEIVIKNY